jgi:hypothetical protein
LLFIFVLSIIAIPTVNASPPNKNTNIGIVRESVDLSVLLEIKRVSLPFDLNTCNNTIPIKIPPIEHESPTRINNSVALINNRIEIKYPRK